MTSQNTENPSFEDLVRNLGYDPSLATVLPVRAQVEELDVNTSSALIHRLAETKITAGMEEAASPVTDSGKPRILKLTAWMAHSGPANRNGDAFLDEDLP